MERTDIAAKGLYIRRIIHVIRSENRNHHQLLQVNGRHSDAVVYILSGSCTYRIEGGDTFTAKAGDILYLAYKAVYTMYIHGDDYRFIFCDFAFDEEGMRQSGLYRPENTVAAEEMFRKLLQAHLSGSAGFAESMALLYGIYGTVIRTAAYTGEPRGTDAGIRRAKTEMDERYADLSFSVETLAEGMGISAVYFRKLFKKRYGVTPSEYLTSVRIAAAREYLDYPFLTLEDCARRCGYASAAYFCRVFKKTVGMTPTEYRNRA